MSRVAHVALTAASLRVEMEAAKQQARAAQQEVRLLKERLARTLGAEVAATHSEHTAAASAAADLHAQVQQLLTNEAELAPPTRATPSTSSKPHAR